MASEPQKKLYGILSFRVNLALRSSDIVPDSISYFCRNLNWDHIHLFNALDFFQKIIIVYNFIYPFSWNRKA